MKPTTTARRYHKDCKLVIRSLDTQRTEDMQKLSSTFATKKGDGKDHHKDHHKDQKEMGTSQRKPANGNQRETRGDGNPSEVSQNLNGSGNRP